MYPPPSPPLSFSQVCSGDMTALAGIGVECLGEGLFEAAAADPGMMVEAAEAVVGVHGGIKSFRKGLKNFSKSSVQFCLFLFRLIVSSASQNALSHRPEVDLMSYGAAPFERVWLWPSNEFAVIASQAALSNQLDAGGKPQIDARTMESAGRLYNRLMKVSCFYRSLCSSFRLSSLRRCHCRGCWCCYW